MDDFQCSFSTPFENPLVPGPLALLAGTVSRNGIDVVTASMACQRQRADHARA